MTDDEDYYPPEERLRVFLEHHEQPEFVALVDELERRALDPARMQVRATIDAQNAARAAEKRLGAIQGEYAQAEAKAFAIENAARALVAKIEEAQEHIQEDEEWWFQSELDALRALLDIGRPAKSP